MAEDSPIPLVDLSLQYQLLRVDVLQQMDTLFAESAFIGGRYVRDFEKAFSDYCGVGHAIGVANGTEALHVVLRVLRVGVGDEVILPAHTFIATAEAVRLVGAKPVFAEIEADTFCVSARTIAEKITSKTKVIIPVHLYGYVVPDMPAIEALAKSHGLALLGDAAQAHGAKLFGKGVAQYADISTFSFYPGKNLGAYGDAGAIVTDDAVLAKACRQFQNHGRTEKYMHDTLGTNARLDALQALILSIKLPHLSAWNQARRQVASWYAAAFDGVVGLILPSVETKEALPAFHLYVVRVAKDKRDSLLQSLQAVGIGAGVHYPVPLHLQPCYHDLGYREGDFPVTEEVANTILSLPIYPELTETQVSRVVDTVKRCL